MDITRLLFACALLFMLATGELRAADELPAPVAKTISFAYRRSHPVTALPDAVIARLANPAAQGLDASDAFDAPHDAAHETLQDTPVDMRMAASRPMSRSGMCNAVAAVARANDLPIPFFANLIWQESNFDTRSISPAGALGVAQYMPQTASEQGLINPFEPTHALHVAGRFLRRLQAQFGNLGLAAAAYNAGAQRVTNWIARRGGLPNETRAYVARITGRAAEQWTSNSFVHDPESTLLPARAPCLEVAEAVETQTKVVRVARLITELAAATAPPPRNNPDKFDEAAWQVASADPQFQHRVMAIVRGALKNIAVRMAHRTPRPSKPAKPAVRELAKAPAAKVHRVKTAIAKPQKPAAVRGREAAKRTHVASAR